MNATKICNWFGIKNETNIGKSCCKILNDDSSNIEELVTFYDDGKRFVNT